MKYRRTKVFEYDADYCGGLVTVTVPCGISGVGKTEEQAFSMAYLVASNDPRFPNGYPPFKILTKFESPENEMKAFSPVIEALLQQVSMLHDEVKEIKAGTYDAVKELSSRIDKLESDAFVDEAVERTNHGNQTD